MSSAILWGKRKNSNIFCFQAERQPREQRFTCPYPKLSTSLTNWGWIFS